MNIRTLVHFGSRPAVRVSAVLAALALALPVARAQEPPVSALTVAFSNPDRPGSIRVALVTGGVTVRAGNRRDVAISVANAPNARGRSEPANGLRRLTPVTGLSISEDQNEMTIRASADRARHLDIETPARVDLKLSTVNGGDIEVDGAEGEIEVTNANGNIRLTNVAGAVVANTTNGDVIVTLARVDAGKPMAFTSFNGDVDVTIPASTKATVRLRSGHGDILTDFDIETRPAEVRTTRGARGTTRIEITGGVTGTINGGGPDLELRTFNGDVRLRKAGG